MALPPGECMSICKTESMISRDTVSFPWRKILSRLSLHYLLQCKGVEQDKTLLLLVLLIIILWGTERSKTFQDCFALTPWHHRALALGWKVIKIPGTRDCSVSPLCCFYMYSPFSSYCYPDLPGQTEGNFAWTVGLLYQRSPFYSYTLRVHVFCLKGPWEMSSFDPISTINFF